MRRKDVIHQSKGEYLGYCHLAFSVGSKAELIELTERLREDSYQIVGEPLVIGNGCFESVALDVDSNRVELVA